MSELNERQVNLLRIIENNTVIEKFALTPDAISIVQSLIASRLVKETLLFRSGISVYSLTLEGYQAVQDR